MNKDSNNKRQRAAIESIYLNQTAPAKQQQKTSRRVNDSAMLICKISLLKQAKKNKCIKMQSIKSKQTVKK
jgi:hypothetical protein